jgi:hypothetical protein
VSTGNGGGLAQVAAAVTAVVGIVTSLAVTGILAQAQRNHGVWLLAAFACVVAGAMLWLAVATLHRPAALKKFAWLDKSVVQTVALVATAAGLMLAIWAMVLTQKDTERPSVSATFDRGTRILTASAEAHGLSSDERLVVLVTGLVPKTTGRAGAKAKANVVFREATPSLYYAVIGPDSGGEVTHAAQVSVPVQYKFVAVKAWTGARETKCETIPPKTGVPQRVLAGCLFLRLPLPLPGK